MKRASTFIYLLVLSIAGCTKPEGYRLDHYHQQVIQDLPMDQKIPVSAWDLLEGKEPAAEHGPGDEHGAKPDGHGGGGGGTSASAALKNTVLGEVKVFLVEKNPGVLIQPAIEISFPRGGGAIDLSAYTTGQRGSFFVGFDVPLMATATRKKVLFFSQARKRKLEGQIFGAGCRKYFDITEGFAKAMTLEGLKVNTTQERHLSVLGGAFYFAADNGNEMSVAKVRFYDSQKKQLFCQEN